MITGCACDPASIGASVKQIDGSTRGASCATAALAYPLPLSLSRLKHRTLRDKPLLLSLDMRLEAAHPQATKRWTDSLPELKSAGACERRLDSRRDGATRCWRHVLAMKPRKALDDALISEGDSMSRRGERSGTEARGRSDRRHTSPVAGASTAGGACSS